MSEESTVEEHWRHKDTGEVYWVELDGSDVTDAFGPLSGEQLTPEELSGLHFNAHGDIIQWVVEHRAEFEVMPDPVD